MSKYVLISSRDPFEHGDALSFYETCGGLKDAGADVTLMLVQNGVLPSRESRYSVEIASLCQKGVKVLADRYALETRGIKEADLIQGVSSGDLDLVIDHMAEGSKVIWH